MTEEEVVVKLMKRNDVQIPHRRLHIGERITTFSEMPLIVSGIWRDREEGCTIHLTEDGRPLTPDPWSDRQDGTMDYTVYAEVWHGVGRRELTRVWHGWIDVQDRKIIQSG